MCIYIYIHIYIYIIHHSMNSLFKQVAFGPISGRRREDTGRPIHSNRHIRVTGLTVVLTVSSAFSIPHRIYCLGIIVKGY